MALQRVVVEDSLIVACSCGAWQVESPHGTSPDHLGEALWEHWATCAAMQSLRVM